MPTRQDFTNIWKNLQEVDLRPISDLAQEEVRIAIVGAHGVGKHTLAKQMREDPDRPKMRTTTPLILATPDIAESASLADVVVLMIDANTKKAEVEQRLLDAWRLGGKPVFVFFNKVDLLPEEGGIIPWLEAGNVKVVYGSALDRSFLKKAFTKALMETLPEKQIPLGRLFPLCRETVAHKLIVDACFANAAYSLGTGLAEIVPVLDIPLNVADIFVLTKAQAILVYKLGLTLGMPLDWQYYVAEFGSVVGSGFLWRQVARQMVGLIPVWGIVPKVGVAYSGTFVVGYAILQWYLTGRHIPKEQIQDLSKQAFLQGKEIAQGLLDKVPQTNFKFPKIKLPRINLPKRKPKALPETVNGDIEQIEKKCPTCKTLNDQDALFCKRCAQPLD